MTRYFTNDEGGAFEVGVAGVDLKPPRRRGLRVFVVNVAGKAERYSVR
jgi:hypothetical protein